jgi:hypothetical protein
MGTLYCEFRMPGHEEYERKLIASRDALRRFSTLLTVKKDKFMAMSLCMPIHPSHKK